MQDIKEKVFVAIYKHLLKQHKNEPLTDELNERLLKAASEHVKKNLAILIKL